MLTNEAPARVESDCRRRDSHLARNAEAHDASQHPQTYEYRATLLEPLRSVRIDKLTTKSIREWHDGIDAVYSANKALSVLKSALALHAEDTGTRSIAMPTNLQKRVERPTRKHLSIDQVRAVIASGSIYVAFPFLAGTRISEQLGLCWDCVDFDAGVIHIKRIQDKQTGKLIETTKTASGQRIIPMSETLRRMLTEWKPNCPSLERVFPAPQGGMLLYNSYLRRIWTPVTPADGTAAVVYPLRQCKLHIDASGERHRIGGGSQTGWAQDASGYASILHARIEGRRASDGRARCRTGTTAGITSAQ